MNVTQLLIGILTAIVYWFHSFVLFLIPRKYRFKSVANDVVLITGGGSGFGRLLAIKFAQLGAKVVVWDIDDNGLQQTKHAIKKFAGNCYAYVCDVTKRTEVYSMAEKVKTEVGNVTILVNNAGIVAGKPLLDLDDQMIVKTYEVNVLAHYWTCKAFLPAMRTANSGHIVSIASAGGLNAVPYLTDYTASKFAAVGFQEALALETYFDDYKKINFTTVCPYFMDTGMFAGTDCDVFAMLDPEYAADEAMTAILSNQDFVVIPRFFYLTFALKAIASWKAYRRAYEAFGFHKLMHTFEGKKRK